MFSIGNGYISTDTLKEILRELDNKLSDADLDGIIEEVDEDGSGTLDFDGIANFKRFITPLESNLQSTTRVLTFSAEFMEMMAG